MRTVAAEFRAGIARLAPDLLDEMRGVADGVSTYARSGGEAWADAVDVLDIVALNARSEIALGQWDDGCTAVAWRIGGGDGTRLGADAGPAKQILAQNWDWRDTVGKNLAMVSIARAGKPKLWMVTEVRAPRRLSACRQSGNGDISVCFSGTLC